MEAIAQLLVEVAEHLRDRGFEAAAEQAERAACLRAAWEGVLPMFEKNFLLVYDGPLRAQAADCLK